MGTIDFSKQLNPQQFAAATAPDGRSLVLAAAGTGKTRTLVYRVAHLFERGIPSDRILLLTFTNRAAREMLDRARELVGPEAGSVWGGTFHHMANRILRLHAGAIGFSSAFTILDREDARSLVSACVKDGKAADKDMPRPDVLLSLFSASANTETALEETVIARLGDSAVDVARVLNVHREYERRKRELGAMDFDDLLVNGLRLFRERADILDRYQERFLHVLVDEYQDTNTLQAELVDRVAAKNGNLLVVGDDFQCIYSWRGADYRNILTFPERYPDARIYKLEINYRSVPEILHMANACIAGNPEQFQKTLRPVRKTHRKPVVFRVRDGGEQARLVADELGRLRRNGYKYSDIAVLYRAHFHSLELQVELTRDRVPYAITSGARFFEQVHIKDVCSFLRLLENADDEMAFARLLGLLPGVREKTAAKVWAAVGRRFDASDEGQRRRIAGLLPPKARPVWGQMEAAFGAGGAEAGRGAGVALVDRFIEAFYGHYAARTFEKHERRIEDIREMALYASRYDSLDSFLSDVALLTNLDAEAEELSPSGGDGVRLSTVHQAKGLEWPVVILLWMSEGMFPSARTLNESAEGEAEERRLFYVAVTRAKDELILCVPEVRRMKDGGVFFCSPSRFVEELPRGLVQEVSPGFV